MGSARRIVNLHSGEIDTTEIDSQLKSFKISDSGDHEWRNQSRIPIKLPIVCKIPEDVLIMIRTIEAELEKSSNSKLEFGGFLKGKFENGSLNIEKDITISKQKVSYASIDFEEEPPEHYNGVIHRHPSGCNNFSSTDDGSINQNYEFSLLYCNNMIITGVYNIKVGTTFVQVPLKPEIVYPIAVNADINSILSKIEQNNVDNHVSSRLLSETASFHNPLLPSFENLEFPQTDDNFEDLYACPYCNKYQKIYTFPSNCENCTNEISEDEAVEVSDLNVSELDIKQMNKIKLSNCDC